MREITYGKAINEALREEMARDETVFVLGEDVAIPGGVFKVTEGLVDDYGKERVIDTPIQELSLMGASVGAAMAGMRPVLEIMFGDFMTLPLDQVVNEAAKMRYMTGGQVTVPLTVRTTMGPANNGAAQHSQTIYAWFAHVPGVKVCVSATPYDAKGLMISSIRDPNPVIIFEDKSLYGLKGEVPEEEYVVPLGEADIKREGEHVTIIALARMVHLALKAADQLAEKGISAEVIDPRSIYPLDTDALIKSATKTGNVICIDTAVRRFGVMAEIASTIYEGAFGYLNNEIVRFGAKEVPVPFTPALEKGLLPTVDDVVAKAEAMVSGQG